MEQKFRLPKPYGPKLTPYESQKAIKFIRDTFQNKFSSGLNLTRVSAPLFVLKSSGLNDNLSGSEHPVSFETPEIPDEQIEIIHSLAKWKRDALYRYGYPIGDGLYTDMNAIRKDEFLDNTHSLYVDQWDWELIIDPKDRTLEFLKATIRKIYGVVKELESALLEQYPQLRPPNLPEDIYFITSQTLETRYPDATPEEREAFISKEKGAVCILQIGECLESGTCHGHRAPDYDDWALNADIIFHHHILDEPLEMSSLGIRVNAKSLDEQLQKAGASDRSLLPYHQNILNGVLPQTIGGGIGQSRLCMFLLQKAHIGEVQVSVWDPETIRQCAAKKIPLL